MNELIKELVAQSGFGVRQNEVYTSKLEHLPITENIQKFAELIVQECMDNLEWHGHDEAVSQLEWFKVNKLGIK